MLYSININQRAFIEIAPNTSIEAACILNMMQQKMSLSFFQKDTIKENGKLYFWFSHGLIKLEMPMLFKGTESDSAISLKVRRWANELEENGLLERHPNAKSLKRSMYCFTEKCDSITVKNETYKNEQVKEQTYKNERLRRTKTNVSDAKQTYKNVRGKEYPILLEEENKEESEKENLQFSTLPLNPDDIIDNVPPKTLQPIIENGKLTISNATEKKLIDNTKAFQDGGGVKKMLSKNAFELSESTKALTTESELEVFKMVCPTFKEENFFHYIFSALVTFFDTEEGKNFKGFDKNDLNAIHGKIMKYKHFIIDRVNIEQSKASQSETGNELKKVITWKEYDNVIKPQLRSKQITEQEYNAKHKNWEICFATTNHRGSIYEVEKWTKENLKKQQISC